MERYAWHPGIGIETASLGRLRSKFTRPNEPMGEAWFMGGERRLFGNLQGDLASLTASELQEPLQEIASGTGSFGPYAEWNVWYHYLLGQLLPRSHETYVSSLAESLITAFMALYPNGVHRPPYPEFRNDALRTLGQCMMEPHCWTGNEIIVGQFLHRSNNNPKQVWCWWDASGDFSASLFFCLKYLPRELVHGWFSSVLSIDSPHWRAQVLVWLVGANDILHGRVKWPSEFRINAYPSINWDWSHCLRPELATSDDSEAPVMGSLLSEASRTEVLELTCSHFTEDVFLEWLESITSVSYLASELAAIPSTFESLYVQHK